ncbi:mitochondrial ribosomal protein 10 [Whalleya microplaca]|nr:mitochondrial ribosomal protein 10 [Whalleya microplaca]
MAARQKPMRLPPLKTLRVRHPNGQRERPCVALMSSVLACWASAGHATTGCLQVENALRTCMDGPQPSGRGHSEINYHLMRFKDRLLSTQKRRKG